MPPDTKAASEKGLRTAVIFCQDLADPGMGLDLKQLRTSLEAAFPGLVVEVTPGLCGHLAQSLAARRGIAQLVLGLCSGEYSPVELQAGARKAGLDPFGVEVVPLGTWCAKVHRRPEATRKAGRLLAAAIARTQAYPESGPEHAKPYFLSRGQKLSRRSLFTLPPMAYRPVPSVRGEACVAEAGCQLCANACPRDALRKMGGHMALDKARCEGCGICLAVCPRDAINFPGWSLAQMEAQLGAILSPASADRPLGLLLACQKAMSTLEEMAGQGLSYSHHWMPVAVPCLGMATPTWAIQALAHGAETLALLSCGADCPFGQEQAIGGMANFCRRLLRLMGQDPEQVRVFNAGDPQRLLQALQQPPPQRRDRCRGQLREPLRLGSVEAAFASMKHLAGEKAEVSGLVLEHPYSPFGVVELRSEGCTGCLACAPACPTGALASERGGDGVTITYLASSCIGCGICAEVCPEKEAGVLRVRQMTSWDALSRGRAVLYRDQLVTCEGCGASIASRALLQRLEASLEGSEPLRTALSRYCPSCRFTFALGARPSFP